MAIGMLPRRIRGGSFSAILPLSVTCRLVYVMLFTASVDSSRPRPDFATAVGDWFRLLGEGARDFIYRMAVTFT